MKAAVVQLHARDRKDENLRRAIDLVSQAARRRAKLICLPEVFDYRGRWRPGTNAGQIAEDIPGDTTRAFAAIARRQRVFILLGSIHERVPGSRKAYNTSLLIDDRGNIKARYRKIHLFDAVVGAKRIRETRIFLPGRRPGIARVKDLKIGMSVCFDLRFPDLYRRYFRDGCQVMAVPSCFTRATGKVHWEILLRARAIENLCYVLAPNQVGRDNNGITGHGHSMIVGPRGEILARAGADKEAVVYADLSMKAVTRARRRFSSMNKTD